MSKLEWDGDCTVDGRFAIQKETERDGNSYTTFVSLIFYNPADARTCREYAEFDNCKWGRGAVLSLKKMAQQIADITDGVV